MASIQPAGSLSDLRLARPRVLSEPRNVTLDVLHALAHPARLELVSHIAARGPLCVCHLHADLGYSQPTISKHLGVLRRAGLVDARRDGRWVYYTLNEAALDAAGDYLAELKGSMARPRPADRCSDPEAQ